ncbi:MAG TPA: type II toxin-antitoxin system Phd/YefM family antitoxin [Candidatus Ornithomonoglobus intestinigallinarum]|uniref:Type II toxin-antitoxin system Phd/YefM family antitoxin n=1 Tax=Candidatus Ornithomonoglobus intestinigallinarum TaxID=2840894 RepID=A0A9D1H112_9FIRM|nr:type II toxin-antitoxin system Phd/YefM family antitoxin [Candidatus Ornithomonoglobus intestinigallinarum]
MKVDTNTMVSISEANRNFSKITRLVDKYGSAVILKNNSPRYLVLDFNQAGNMAAATDSDVFVMSEKLISQNAAAYEELAK